eukprot:CAMPEP_0170486288 /NCGR_PEP_ID=MMETSP0208-20121228/5338_1 /TAXON_ID=197538 /ORGANISM="Strombidium inclinatum, Strain S3" /LENGTH=78 /DNA_ID=CAMNT_0010760181 /DNA_START=140 /DNA_END=376 /DNA_ORIENTATION=-
MANISTEQARLSNHLDAVRNDVRAVKGQQGGVAKDVRGVSTQLRQLATDVGAGNTNQMNFARDMEKEQKQLSRKVTAV